MISYKNDNTGSRYSVASKIGIPTTEFIYPPIQKRQIIRGAATNHPDFLKCRETPNTTRLFEPAKASNVYTNGYPWNKDPIRTNESSVTL